MKKNIYDFDVDFTVLSDALTHELNSLVETYELKVNDRYKVTTVNENSFIGYFKELNVNYWFDGGKQLRIFLEFYKEKKDKTSSKRSCAFRLCNILNIEKL